MPHLEQHHTLFRWSRYLVLVILFSSILVLLGWQLNDEFLKHPLPLSLEMNPTTALLFILTVIAYLLLSSGKATPAARLAGYGLAVIVSFTGLLKITALFLEWPAAIDSILFTAKLPIAGSAQLNAMAGNTAFSFILAGIALLLLRTETKRKRLPAQYLAIITALWALLAIISYIYRAEKPFYGSKLPLLPGIHAALCFFLLSLAILFTYPSRGIMKELTGKLTGSTTARLLIPVAIVIPLVLGLVRMMGYWSGDLSTAWGISLLVYLIIMIFLAFIWNSTLLLNKRDALRMQVQDQLKESEAEIQTIFKAAPDAVIVINESGVILSWNPKAETIFGWSATEAIGQSMSNMIIPQRYREAYHSGMKHFLKTGKGPVLNKTIEIQAINKAGNEFDISLGVSPTNTKEGYIFIGFIRDMTEKKNAAKQINYLVSLIEQTSDAIFSTDNKFIIKSWNKSAEKIYGFTREEAIGQEATTLIKSQVSPAEREKAMADLEQQGFYQNEFPYTTKDGRVVFVMTSVSAIRETGEEITGYVIIHRDITARRKAEDALNHLNAELEQRMEERTEELAKSEKRFRALVENNEGIISLVDEKLNILFRSASAVRMTGWTNKEYEQTNAAKYIHPDDLGQLKDAMTLALQQPGENIPLSMRVQHKEGHYIWLEGIIKNMLHDPAVKGIITNMLDVTDRKKAEEKIMKANRLYLFISQVNQMIVHTKDQETLFRKACHIAVEYGKFKMAWIGMIDEATQKIIPVMHAGEDSDYPQVIKRISVHDSPDDRGPTGTALRQGRYTISNDIPNDPLMAPWKAEAIRRGYRSSMALPIRKSGKVVGVFSFYTDIKNFFDAEEIVLLEEATNDVSFALDVIEKEALRKQAEETITKTNERLKLAQEISHSGYWEFDLAGNKHYWSDELYNIFEYDKTNGIPDMATYLSFIHPADVDILIRHHQDTIEKGIPLEAEFRFMKKDGTYKYLVVRGSRVTGQNGNAIRLEGITQDITTRKKTEEDIRKINERFELIGKAANDALWEWNIETNELWGNEAHQQLYGRTTADPVAEDDEWRQRLPEEDRETIIAGLEKVLASDKNIWDDEYRMYTDNKGWIHVYGRTYIERNSAGKPIRLLGSMMDITARKKAEQQVRESEERYRSLIEQASDPIIIYSLDGKILDYNQAFVGFTGYNKNDMKNLVITDLLFTEDIREKPLVFEDILQGKPVHDVRRGRKKDGTAISIELNSKMMADGNIMAIARDITERRKAEEKLLQSEQKYRMLFEDNPMPLWMFSTSDLRFMDVNEAAIRQYGYTREEFLGMTIKDIRPKATIEKLVQETQKKDAGVRYAGLWQHYKKNGEMIHVDIFSHDTVYEGKSVRLVLAVDVTERIKAEQELQQSYNNIRELASHLQQIREEERLKMAREVHDELGQQLTVMKMDISWLNKTIEKKDGPVKEKLEALKNMLDNTVRTVRRIATELRPSILDDMGLVAAIEWHLNEFEKRSGIKTILNARNEELSLPDNAAIGLFRIVQESLTNVARYAKAKTVTVTLSNKDKQLQLSIEDDGIGFNQKKIAIKKTLGIIGMKERTTMMGGTYQINSQPGKGTKVVVEIPLHSPSASWLKKPIVPPSGEFE